MIQTKQVKYKRKLRTYSTRFLFCSKIRKLKAKYLFRINCFFSRDYHVSQKENRPRGNNKRPPCPEAPHFCSNHFEKLGSGQVL